MFSELAENLQPDDDDNHVPSMGAEEGRWMRPEPDHHGNFAHMPRNRADGGAFVHRKGPRIPRIARDAPNGAVGAVVAGLLQEVLVEELSCSCPSLVDRKTACSGRGAQGHQILRRMLTPVRSRPTTGLNATARRHKPAPRWQLPPAAHVAAHRSHCGGHASGE